MSIVGIVVAFIIIGLLFWAVATLSATFKIPPPVVVVFQVLLVLVLVLFILQAFGIQTGGPIIRLN